MLIFCSPNFLFFFFSIIIYILKQINVLNPNYHFYYIRENHCYGNLTQHGKKKQ